MMNSGKRKLYREGNIEDFYVIEEESSLGEGASAVVRRAIKRDTGEPVAIKILDRYQKIKIKFKF